MAVVGAQASCGGARWECLVVGRGEPGRAWGRRLVASREGQQGQGGRALHLQRGQLLLALVVLMLLVLAARHEVQHRC